MLGRHLFLGIGLTLPLVVTAVLATDVKDATGTDPGKLGVRPVEARKDPRTGFVVGGKNATTLIRRLTEINGRTIAALEKDMRPRKLSGAGFLGKDERLLDVLAADNDAVVGLGLTHQKLALHLHVLGALAVKHALGKPKEVTYHGRKYRLTAVCSRGFQDSPFADGTKTNCEATVENLDNGKKIWYSLLLPHMMERYGFYEGKGTRFRLEPRAIVEVLDFLRPAGP